MEKSNRAIGDVQQVVGSQVYCCNLVSMLVNVHRARSEEIPRG